jgi:excisionase family DNA binding protein
MTDVPSKPSEKTAGQKFFTVEQIAEAMQVHPRTVRRWIEKELLAAHKLGVLVRIADSDFRAFLALCRGY